MHGRICQIGAVGKLNRVCCLSVVLLLIQDEMLSARNNTCILNALDSLPNSDTSKHWIGAEAWKVLVHDSFERK